MTKITFLGKIYVTQCNVVKSNMTVKVMQDDHYVNFGALVSEVSELEHFIYGKVCQV